MRHPTKPNPTYGAGQDDKFCRDCGRRLVERQVADGYDTRTGRPKYERRRDCPIILGIKD